MTNKRYTDEDIISSLEVIATTGNCNECKIRNCKWGTCNCSQITANAALDFINWQKSEIERLRAKVETRTQEKLALGRIYTQKLKTVKYETYYEAINEFAEVIKEEIENAYNNNSKVLSKHMSKYAECPNYEFIATVQGKMNTLRGLDDFIDNLLKEMVGEDNA